MLKSAIPAFAVLFAASSPASGANEQAKQTISSVLSLDTTDRILVAYAPQADFAADDVQRFEITDAKAVQIWLKELSKIPAKGGPPCQAFRRRSRIPY